MITCLPQGCVLFGGYRVSASLSDLLLNRKVTSLIQKTKQAYLCINCLIFKEMVLYLNKLLGSCRASLIVCCPLIPSSVGNDFQSAVFDQVVSGCCCLTNASWPHRCGYSVIEINIRVPLRGLLLKCFDFEVIRLMSPDLL